MHRISLNTAARVLNIHVLFCLKVREACIFCVFKSLQLFCFKSDFRKKINYTKNKHNFAACQNGAVVARGVTGGEGCAVCCVTTLPVCQYVFTFFTFLGFPCKSIQLYYFVIVFQEFCISKLLSVFEGGISSAVTGAREGGHWLGGGIIMYVHIFLLGINMRKRSIALEIVHFICIP